ncbi:MAG: YraN family protein [Chloroflexi bacterium]|nr:YraN family protein [Chloroflexota bacterium]
MERTRTSAQIAGDDAEELVARRLTEGGWTILGRNVRAGRAELDIVAVDPGPPRELVVVEVRFRARRDFGLPEETITHRKRQLLRAAASSLRELGRLPHLPARFDLVVVEPGSPTRIRHHRSAW